MKNKILIISFIGIISFFTCFSIILKDQEISYFERRKLTTFPEFTTKSLFDGSYFEQLNNYFVDHFPLRENFLKLKGITATKIFQKKENNNTFIKEDAIYQIDSTINNKSLDHFTNILNQVYKSNIKSQKVYYSIIPDKNYYLNDSFIPKLDYHLLTKQISEKLTQNFQYIDITNELSLDSYYRTDIHWKQEKLEPVVKKIAKEMNFTITNYPTTKKTYSPFYGALYGRIASNIKADTITYLTNSTIQNLSVYNYEKNNYEKVYVTKNLNNIDSYDIFLSGATPLLIIENPMQEQSRELIIFRDSFASSIIPLLGEAYSKITVIDLRYLSSSLLNDIPEINFQATNLDILFLYSIPIINQSFAIK